MKKVIIGMFVFALLASTVVYAERGRDTTKQMRAEKVEKLKERFKNASSTREVLKSIDASCVSSAVAEREDSIMSAWNTFQSETTTLMEDRKAQLVNAWSIEDVAERRAELKEIAKSIKMAKKEVSKEYKDARKSAWKEFKTSAKACGGAEGSEAAKESETVEKIEI